MHIVNETPKHSTHVEEGIARLKKQQRMVYGIDECHTKKLECQ